MQSSRHLTRLDIPRQNLKSNKNYTGIQSEEVKQNELGKYWDEAFKNIKNWTWKLDLIAYYSIFHEVNYRVYTTIRVHTIFRRRNTYCANARTNTCTCTCTHRMRFTFSCTWYLCGFLCFTGWKNLAFFFSGLNAIFPCRSFRLLRIYSSSSYYKIKPIFEYNALIMHMLSHGKTGVLEGFRWFWRLAVTKRNWNQTKGKLFKTKMITFMIRQRWKMNICLYVRP